MVLYTVVKNRDFYTLDADIYIYTLDVDTDLHFRCRNLFIAAIAGFF